jgi:hypothetical protein
LKVGVFCFYEGGSTTFVACKCNSGYYTECSRSTCGSSYSFGGSPATCPPKTYCPSYTQCPNGNCVLAGPDPDCTCSTPSKCVGKCCPKTGKCKAASCDGNKINNPSGHEHECVVSNDGTNQGGQCPWSGYAYGVKCNYLAGCSTGVKNNCWGYTACAVGTCPDSAIGVFCIESGNSVNFKICGCSGRNTVGSAANCSAAVAPQTPPVIQKCANGNCALPLADPTCSAGCTSCIGKCCASTGKCQAASCDGNKINNPSGHEHECVLKSDGTNLGGQCPWSGQSYGVKCSYLAGCGAGNHQNCWGYTTCSTGTCPSTAVGVFCIESGASDNFKICGCSGEGTSIFPDGAAVSNCSGTVPVVDDGGSPCPAGYYCPNSCTATKCPCGSYCPAPATAATKCPAGKYCPEGSSAPMPCPAGYLCSGSTCVPQICPCGSRCPAGTSRAQKCAPPYYCPDQGQSVQTLCPIGYKCDKVGLCSATKCPPGTFVTCAGKKACDQCPAGRYCSNSTLNVICPAGSFCPAGSSAPSPCRAGTYSYKGASACKPCPAKFCCPTANMTGYSGYSCPANTQAGKSTCPGGCKYSGTRRLLSDSGDSDEAEAAAPIAVDIAVEAGRVGPAAAAAYSAFTLAALFGAGVAIRAVRRGAKEAPPAPADK